MIPNREGWHYLELKKLFGFLGEIMSKHVGDIYCLNCRHSFGTKQNPESQKKVCENKDFSGVIMPSEDTKILVVNQY